MLAARYRLADFAVEIAEESFRSGSVDYPSGSWILPAQSGLAEALDRIGPERVSAFIAEPVIGAGGVLAAPDGYFDAVRKICTDRDVLLIADEVITGFGRLGEWFGSQRLGFVPDLMTCAKGITSGYLPLGAVVASGRIAEPF